jgi:hypothetical protein
MKKFLLCAAIAVACLFPAYALGRREKLGADKQRHCKHLYGVWGNGATDVFVVGDGGTILHYGTGLSVQVPPSLLLLLDY